MIWLSSIWQDYSHQNFFGKYYGALSLTHQVCGCKVEFQIYLVWYVLGNFLFFLFPFVEHIGHSAPTTLDLSIWILVEAWSFWIFDIESPKCTCTISFEEAYWTLDSSSWKNLKQTLQRILWEDSSEDLYLHIQCWFGSILALESRAITWTTQ